jgi:hypothetical protein
MMRQTNKVVIGYDIWVSVTNSLFVSSLFNLFHIKTITLEYDDKEQITSGKLNFIKNYRKHLLINQFTIATDSYNARDMPNY